MLRTFFIALFFLMALDIASVQAVYVGDSDLSLVPQPPPKPAILGIPFEATPGAACKLLTAKGLTLVSQEAGDERGYVQVIIFDGIPPGLQEKEGQSRLVFFKNQLFRMDFIFVPSYRTFLVVRSRLFHSLGKRFTVDQKQEEMDSYLRAHLASVNVENFNGHAEDLIRQSVLLGKTFFYYALKDHRNELNITYSFTAHQNEKGIPVPTLMLHYSLKDAFKAYESYSRSLERGALLPGTAASYP